MKEKFFALAWTQRVMVLLQCFLSILFLILYAVLGCAWDGWVLFAAGVLLCAACAASILYADELYRWNLSFSIRDPEDVEPTDWVFISRWISWTLGTVCALAFFIIGLTVA